MSTPPTRPEFDLLTKLIEQGFDGVHERLDKLNGKTEDHGNRIAKLEGERGRVDIGTILSLLAIVIAALGVWFAP